MPGYEVSTDSFGNRSLGLGKIRPTPSAVPSGGFGGSFDGPQAPHLRAMVAQQQGKSAQATARSTGLLSAPPPGPNPHELAMLNYGRSGPMPVGARQNLHAFGDTGPGTQDLHGVSGSAMYGQGLASMRDRNGLERNLENEQANVHGALHAALTGNPPAPFEAMVGGSIRRPDQVASYNRAFPGPANPVAAGMGAGVAGLLGVQPGARGAPSPTKPGGVLAGAPAAAPRVVPPSPPPAPSIPPIPMGANVSPAAMAAMPAQRRPGGPAPGHPAGAPSAPGVPAPGTPEHLDSAARLYHANPNMRTAIAYDYAQRMFDARKEDAVRSAQVDQILAQTAGDRLRNQGIPTQTKLTAAQVDQILAQTAGINLENQGIPAKNQEAAAKARAADQAANAGVTGRGMADGLGSGNVSPAAVRDEIRLNGPSAAPQPGASSAAPRPTGAPTYDQAFVSLFGGDHPMMGVDPQRISPQGGNPIDDYKRARDQGYNLSDPNSQVSDNLQAYLRGKYGQDAYASAGQDPKGWLSSPGQDELDTARWFRDQVSSPGAGGPGSPSAGGANIPVPAPPPFKIPVPLPLRAMYDPTALPRFLAQGAGIAYDVAPSIARGARSAANWIGRSHDFVGGGL